MDWKLRWGARAHPSPLFTPSLWHGTLAQTHAHSVSLVITSSVAHTCSPSPVPTDSLAARFLPGILQTFLLCQPSAAGLCDHEFLGLGTPWPPGGPSPVMALTTAVLKSSSLPILFIFQLPLLFLLRSLSFVLSLRHTHTHPHTHACAHTHIHMHTRTHPHTRTHTHRPSHCPSHLFLCHSPHPAHAVPVCLHLPASLWVPLSLHLLAASPLTHILLSHSQLLSCSRSC